jgi:hypothetical protein
MRLARFRLSILPAILTALALAAGAGWQQTTYVIDPQTGQSVPVNAHQQFIQPQSAEQTYRQPAGRGSRGLFSPSPAYARQTYAPPPASSGSHELFWSSSTHAPQAYAQPNQQPRLVQLI